MAITPSLVFSVTDEQIESFSIWTKNKYGTYNGYLGALKAKAPAIDIYIRTHILPMEMKSILRETEPYIGVNHCDTHISRLQIYRKRIFNKIKYMKGKLGKLAFPIEARQIIIDNRAAFLNRRQAIVAEHMYQQQYFAQYEEDVRLGIQFSPEIRPYEPISIIKKQLTKEEAETCVMDDDCAICLSKHKMMDACNTNCGHQFGRACLTKWGNVENIFDRTRCPICRTDVTEITEYVVDELSLLDQVLLA
jgi:hypothetical protein